MSSWVRRSNRSGIEYGGTASNYYWDYSLNPGAYYDPGLQTYDLALPNCTTYAYGRILETGGQAPISGWHNALAWHSYLINGWTAIPWDINNVKVGDILEWSSGGRNHVAVVEYINSLGQPVTSQSFYRDTSGGSSGTRDYTICGSTKQSVSDWGINNYPNAFFNYNGYLYVYGVAPDYILVNPITYDVGEFKFFNFNKSRKRRRKIYV